MNETQVVGEMALSMQIGTAAYALRLNRIFGIERTGWTLFAVFALMLSAHVVTAGDWTLVDWPSQTQLVHLAVSGLLLIGLVHSGVLWQNHGRAAWPDRMSREQLEEAVGERTALLTEQNLALKAALAQVQQRVEKREADWLEPVGRLAGVVAHHLNNCLTIIQGTASVHLTFETLSPPMAESFKNIQEASERAAELTRDLLAVGQRSLLRGQTFELNDFLRRTVTPLQSVLGEKIRLELQIGTSSIPLWADPAQLERVLIKLAAFVRSSMRGTGSCLIQSGWVADGQRIRALGLDPAPARYAAVFLTDDGRGIPADWQPQLFEPAATLAQLSSAQGLSLPAAAGLIRQMGGAVRATSGQGSGTTFEIYLPMTMGTDSASATL